MEHQFFQQNPFTNDPASDLENDAKLALHLGLYFLASQDQDDGSWPGVHLGATLRNTCHALEALHLFGWNASAGAIEAGISWLLNLSGLFGLTSEEEVVIKLYPSRFKTLAWLGEFVDPDLNRDFEELEEHLDEAGLLRDIMANDLLATMIYVDCLNYLETLDRLSILSQERRAFALDQIYHNVQLWQRGWQSNTQRSHLTNLGDLSYAIDLLFRAGKISKQSDLSDDILTALRSQLDHPDRLRPIPTDVLYCGIQLATHFSEEPEAEQAVQKLIRYLRIKYEKVDLNKETVFFHPLVLRLMFAYHGDKLKAEITRLMLAHERQQLELRRQTAEQDLQNDFKTLLKSRFEINISDIQPLTGGFTEAEVFRVHYSLKFNAVSENSELHLNTIHPNPGSLVIKRGSLESVRESIEQYRNLPESLKPYFATYGQEPQLLKATPQAPCYLIMEDLTYMTTFQDILARIDQGRLSNVQRQDLEQVCTTICTSLFAIYDQTRRDDADFFGAQLSRLYMSHIERNLIRMCHPDKFPHLKDWFRGFWLGKRKYRSIEYYLRKIDSHKAKLKVPYIMLTHGDSHSRNIMLDPQLHQLKLIDLDRFDDDGDYIKDFALLIEDVCVFRFMFDEGYRLYLGNGSSRFGSHTTEPTLNENTIEYPPFSSDAVRLFQQRLLHHLESYAGKLGDEAWKARLWLALAGYLLFLVVKQTDKGNATIVYVEAVKLLDELVTYLDKGTPLGNIPFPGKHPAGVAPESARNGLNAPAWYQEDHILVEVHDGILAFDPTIKCQLASSGHVAQYFAGDPRQPFAVIDGKKQPPTVLLACPHEALNDPTGTAQKRETGSAFQTMLRVSNQEAAIIALTLTQQAFELSNA